ncbi:MAG: universal stress protein [Cryobacterium sp.]
MIVVGVDESAPGDAAIDWAMRRAERLNCPVKLVHSVYDTWLAEGYGYYDSILEAENKLLRDAQAKASAIAPGVAVSTELRHGNAPRELSEFSDEASLIVVGTGKKGRLQGSLFGSVSLQVASMSRCPVAIIPLLEDPEGTVRSGVIVGIDGSTDSVTAVRIAAAEADRTGQELTAIYAPPTPSATALRNIPTDSIRERMDEERVVLAEAVAGLTDRYPDLVVHQRLVEDAAPARVLVDAARTAQLLVVGSHGRGALRRLMMGSVSHEVLLHISSPTIITRIR